MLRHLLLPFNAGVLVSRIGPAAADIDLARDSFVNHCPLLFLL